MRSTTACADTFMGPILSRGVTRNAHGSPVYPVMSMYLRAVTRTNQSQTQLHQQPDIGQRWKTRYTWKSFIFYHPAPPLGGMPLAFFAQMPFLTVTLATSLRPQWESREQPFRSRMSTIRAFHA